MLSSSQYLFITHFIINYLVCFGLDKLARVLYHRYHINNTPYSQNVRWFFIHFIINSYITIYGFQDLVYSLTHLETCSISKWTYGIELFSSVIALHLYHIFHFRLNSLDWLHHISMAIISSPIILLYNNTCTSNVGLWFTSGFPGAIDYFVLWLVKMGYCHKEFEKKLYIYINVWLRSPGCLYSTVLQLGMLPYLHQYSYLEIFGKMWLIFILFWNGQFFMHTTLRDYYSKLSSKISV